MEVTRCIHTYLQCDFTKHLLLCFLYFQIINNQNISAKSAKYIILCVSFGYVLVGTTILDTSQIRLQNVCIRTMQNTRNLNTMPKTFHKS